MMAILLKKRFLPMVCVLLAATTLGGCFTTETQVKQMLDAFAQDNGLEATRTSVQANGTRISEIDARLVQMETLAVKVDKITADLEVINGTIATLAPLPEKMAALEQLVAAQEIHVAQLRKDADAAKTARAELVVGLAKAAIKEDVDAQFKNVDKTLAKLDTDTRALTARDVESGKTVATLKAQAAMLVTDLKTLKDFATQLDADMRDLSKTTKASMTAQNKTIADLGGGMTGILNKDIEMFEARITALREALKKIGGAGTSTGTGKVGTGGTTSP